MNHVKLQADQLGAFACGMMDVIFAFSIVLERHGLLQRAEIADVLAEVQQQAQKQDGQPTARTLVATLMRQSFGLPVAGEQARARFKVIDGG
jgi:hypothetical protein